MTVTAAKALAELNNLTVSGSINYIPTDDAALHGTVAAQSPEAETQVIQSTAVVLSVYSYEPNTRACEVPLELPTSEVTISIRVTMVENGIESTVWEGHVDPMDSRNPSVRFKAQNAGNYVYKVYMNNKFLYQQQLTMK